MIEPRCYDQAVRIRNPRSARTATHRRITNKSRARYGGIVRVTLALALAMVFLMGYVVLTSTMTGLAYALASARQEREALAEQSMRIDDRIAALKSDERLSQIAAKLGMKAPQRFAVVRLNEPVVAQSPQRAVFSSIAGLFMPAAAVRR